MSTNITETEIKLKRNKSQMDTSSVLLQRGEPFYNSNTNELFVGNADNCVLSQLTPINGVKTINGQTGDISVGEGLTTVGNTLSINQNTIVNSIPMASENNQGLMSSDDKSKLDAINIESINNVYLFTYSTSAQTGLYDKITQVLSQGKAPMCIRSDNELYIYAGKEQGAGASLRFSGYRQPAFPETVLVDTFTIAGSGSDKDKCSSITGVELTTVRAQNDTTSQTVLTGIQIGGTTYKLDGGSGTAGVTSLGGVSGAISLNADDFSIDNGTYTMQAEKKVNGISVSVSPQQAVIELETTTDGTTYSANIGLAGSNQAGLLSPAEKAKITSLPTSPTSADANKILSVDSSGNGQWVVPPIVVISVNKNNNTIKYNNQTISLEQLYTNYYANKVCIMAYHENTNAYYTCVSAETEPNYWKFYMSKCNSNNSVSNFEMEFSANTQNIYNVTSYTIPKITSGTVDPTGGVNGDIYIKYQ